MKRILVPCDFSILAKEAFKMAVEIASKSNGTITVFHVIYMPYMADPNFIGDSMAYNPAFISSMEDDAKREFDKLVKELGTDQVKTELVIEIGGITGAVEKLTVQKKIDLVIMGTSGATGATEIFIGSNTEKVVRNSTVPVLAIRKASKVGGIKKILLPTTLDLNQTAFINKVKELQDFFGAGLHILLVNTPTHFRRDAEANESLEEFVKHYKLKDYELHFCNYRNEEEGIIDFAYTNKVDMIAMGTHSRKGLSHVFNGSIAENVVNHITTPIWTYSLRK